MDGETLKLSLEKNFREYGNSKKLYEKCGTWSFSFMDEWFIVPIDFCKCLFKYLLAFLPPFPMAFLLLLLLFYFAFFFFFFRLCHVACTIVVPQVGIDQCPCNSNMGLNH